MARTPAQRGRFGNWLVESRIGRGWDTQEKARTEIQRLTGWRIPQSVYAEWESGRRVPSDANLERLQAFYGGAPAGPVAGQDAVAAAIDRQTQVLKAAIEAQAEEHVRVLEALTGILGQVFLRLGALPERTPDGSADPSGAPRGVG